MDDLKIIGRMGRGGGPEGVHSATVHSALIPKINFQLEM